MDEEYEKGFQLQREAPLPYLQAPLLAGCGGVIHAFSTRQGGCSEGAMATLNTAFHTGDDRGFVLENRRRFLKPLGFRPEEIVAAIQVHGSRVYCVEAADRGRGAGPSNFLGEGDALITAAEGLPLTGYAADCLLLFIVAPEVPAVALAHAGRQGTLQNMARAVVAKLSHCYGADPARMLAALGPGICGRCYTVGRDLAADFSEAGWRERPYLWEGERGVFHLDLAAINRRQLFEAGIKPGRLAGCRWCSSCHPELFYSYRRDRGKTGRMMGLIALTGGGPGAGKGGGI